MRQALSSEARKKDTREKIELGGLELILQTSDLLPDFRRWLLHSGRSFMLFPLRRISWRIVEVAEVGD